MGEKSKDKSKKRKREADGEDGRTAKSLPISGTARVRHIVAEESSLGPIIAATPGITAPSDITFTPYRRTFVSKATDRKRRQYLLQSSQHGRLDYLAQEEQAGSANLKHYLAVYDPEKGEVVITECPKLTLRSSLRPTQEEIDEELEERAEQTYRSQRMALGQEFGTKKAKKVLAEQTVNAINQRKAGETAQVGAAEMAQLDLVKTEGILSAAERRAEIDRSKPRPEPDLEATEVADVYPLDILVADDDLDLIRVNEWQTAVKNQENVKLSMRYVARRLNAVASREDVTDLKLLRYMNIALTWFAALEKKQESRKLPQREKLREKVDAPGPIFESLRRQYTEANFMSKWCVDKFIMFICAMALHIDNFQVDTNDLQEDLHLTPQEISKYFSELGCKVGNPTVAQRGGLSKEAAASHRIARLQIPLEFPKMRAPMRKRR